MELIRINSHKLKIMLTPADMSHFELRADGFAENGDQSGRSVSLLLKELRERFGFEADEAGLSVQFFPSRDGGCEMFISRSSDGKAEEREADTVKEAEKNALQPHRYRSKGSCFRRDFAYRFESLEGLLSVCRRLLEIGYICESTAFYDRGHNYYLLLTSLSASPFSIPEELGFITEYGSIQSPSGTRLFLSEHGEAICLSDAVLQLSRLAQ